ncbi:MAG: DNA integrity scanning protein DisA nucleotide-binding domain protein, partial [Bacteroidota bacterium]
IGAEMSERLLYSIFLKDGPLHDGAVIIDGNEIAAARCVLPLSKTSNMSADFGLRHRAALGLSEVSDALIIVVSEERQEISVVKEAGLKRNVDLITLQASLREHYTAPKQNS